MLSPPCNLTVCAVARSNSQALALRARSLRTYSALDRDDGGGDLAREKVFYGISTMFVLSFANENSETPKLF